MTEQLYRADAYLRDCSARVLASTSAAASSSTARCSTPPPAGSPATRASLEIEGGGSCPIATTVYDTDKTTIVHVAAEGSRSPAAGQSRARGARLGHAPPLMRMHTCLHLLCALVKFPVTGGQVGADEGRLDFDIEDAVRGRQGRADGASSTR